jgi:hypothetical protein
MSAEPNDGRRYQIGELKGKYRWGCDACVVSGGLREGFEGDFVAEAFELGD